MSPKATTTGAFAAGAAVGAVPLGHAQVRKVAEELFAYLPENKVGLLTIGFVVGGAAGIWLKDSYVGRVREVHEASAGSAR